MRLVPAIVVVLCAFVIGCGEDRRPSGAAVPPAAAVPDPPLCDARRGRVVGRVDDPALDELSGLARAGGALWAVEDSGAGPVIHALRADGTSIGAATVTRAAAVDWEAIAAAGNALYVGDIGDNEATRPPVRSRSMTRAVCRATPRGAATRETGAMAPFRRGAAAKCRSGDLELRRRE